MPECIIVEAHFVGDYSGTISRVPAIIPETLDALIGKLLLTHEPITPEQLRRFYVEKVPLPDKSFLFSFDDGIKDQVTNALPILLRRGMAAAFYIPGSMFEGRLPLLERQRFLQYSFPVYDEFLERFIAEAYDTTGGKSAGDLEPTDTTLARMGGYLATEKHYSWQERYYRWLRDIIITPSDFSIVIDRMFTDRFGDGHELHAIYYMNRDDVRTLYEAGMEIGCHGFAHEHLPKLADQRADLERGMEMLAGITGERPRSLSYPYGSYDRRTLDVTRSMGVSFAFTTKNKIAHLSHKRPFTIPRLDIASPRLDIASLRPL